MKSRFIGRITVDGNQTQFSCKLTVDSKLWDTKNISRAEARQHLKRTIYSTRCGYASTIIIKVSWSVNTFITAEKVKNAFLGLEHDTVFQQHNEEYAKQMEASMKAKGTFDKYKTVYKHLQEFITIRYHEKDIVLKELTPTDVPAHK